MKLPGMWVQTPGEAKAFFFTLVGLGTIIIVWLIVDRIRIRLARQRRLRALASERAAELGLSGDEETLLTGIIEAEEDFPTRRAFEQFVEKQLADGEGSPETIRGLRIKLGFDRSPPGHTLSSTRECSEGIEITLSNPEKVWRTSIYEVTETVLVLRVPADCLASLGEGDEVKGSFTHHQDARYFFRTRVHSSAAGPAPLVALSHPELLERFQNREFVRAEVDWKVPVKQISADEFARSRGLIGGGAMAGALTLILTDISEGGMRLMPDERIKAGDYLFAELPLSGRTEPLPAVAAVIASDAAGVRCRFVRMGLTERDDIHREVLRQRRRHKGSPPRPTS